MKLTDREWKEFFIEDIFNVSGTFTTKPQNLILGGKTPRITCASTNNGLDNTYKNKPTEKGKVITIDSATDGFTSYQGYDFIATDHVEKIALKDNEMNIFIGTFIKQSIDSAIVKKYNYGYKFSQTRIKKQKILLPVDSKNKPDYQFMEDYIKEKMLQRRQEYIEYAKNKLKQIKFENISLLKDKKWKEFFIEDIFFIKSVKRLVKEQMIFGDIPFIGASTLNNGITNYISQKNCSFDSNVLGVNYNGSVGEAFYHPYGCIFSDDVKRFHMLNYNDNKFLLLFLATIIKQQKEKFNYGYKFNETRMLRQKILLPVNTNDEPDYIYMEKYIKNIFYKKYSDYLEYVKKAV